MGNVKLNAARIDPALGNVNDVKDPAKPVGGEIISELDPVDSIINPIPGELAFFHRLISILIKLLLPFNPNDREEHDEDGESTEAAELNKTTKAGPLDNESRTVISAEMLTNSKAKQVSAKQIPANIADYIYT